MEQKVLDDTTMIQYLLMMLSEEERTRVEETFFQDDTSFEQLTAREDDLIDDYVRGRLSGKFRTAFEEKLKSDPRWRQRVLFAQALDRRVKESRSEVRTKARPASFWTVLLDAFRSQGSMFQFAMAAGSLALLIGVVWLAWQGVQQREGMQALQASRDSLESRLAEAQKRDQDLNRELAEERTRRQELESNRPKETSGLELMASFILRAGVVRGNNDPIRIAIPGNAQTVRLQLELDPAEDYPSYRVQLRTAAGVMVWSADMLRARTAGGAKSIVLSLPAQFLPKGDYEAELLGMTEGKSEEVGYYYFDVQ